MKADRVMPHVHRAVGGSAVGESFGGVNQPVEGLRSVCVVGRSLTAGDVWGVVHASQHEIQIEIKDLIAVVIGVVWRELHQETSPRLSTLIPGRPFVCLDAGIGEAEWLSELVPRRGAEEVGDLYGVPRSTEYVEVRVRRPGIDPFLQDASIE